MTFWKVIGGAWALVIGLATLITALPFFEVTKDELMDALWPDVAFSLVSATAVAALLYIYFSQREQQVNPADQERVDELLHVLDRSSVRRIQEEDYHLPWPRRTTSPVRVLVSDLGEVEHRFSDPELEAARSDLYEKGRAFLDMEGERAWVASHGDGTYLAAGGVGATDADMDLDKAERLREHGQPILKAARQFLDAHNAFLEIAIARGYDVGALKRDRHPRVRDIDAIFEPREVPSWSNAPSPPPGSATTR